MIRTSLLIASCCLALLREPLCGGDNLPCEYEDTPLDLDYITPSGMTLGEEVAALEGTYSGTWRWYASWEELTIEGGGIEFPAQATFVPSNYRLRERVGPEMSCFEGGIKVDGDLTFTDEQGGEILSIPITAERSDGGDVPSYYARPEFSPISEFSTRLHANVEYDISRVVGDIYFIDEDHLEANFAFGGQSALGKTSSGTEIGYGVTLEVADFR